VRHPEEVEQWRPLVEKYFAPEDVEDALMVMWYESRGRPTAANPNSDARGLFQHLERYWSSRLDATRKALAPYGVTLSGSLYDPEANIAVAAALLYGKASGTGGWQHWEVTHPGHGAQIGSMGPNTYWNGAGYVMRGTPTGRTDPAGEWGVHTPTEQPFSVGLGLGATGWPSTFSTLHDMTPQGATRNMVASVLNLLSNKIAGGQRQDIDTVLGQVSRGVQAVAASQTEPAPTSIFDPLAGTGTYSGGSGSYGVPRSGGRTHRGIDIAAPEGTPVHSIKPGTVTYVGTQDLGGKVVVVTHDDGSMSSYMHLSAWSVSQGDRVQTGSVLGQVGQTGNAEGPHLHFSYQQTAGSYVDPLTVGIRGENPTAVTQLKVPDQTAQYQQAAQMAAANPAETTLEPLRQMVTGETT